MKTKLILFLLCILSLSAKGQGVQFSIEAGATINRPKYSFTHSGSFIGVRVGGWAKLHPISTMPGAYTIAGLLLSTKGDKTLAYIKLSEQELYELTSTNKRNYLEIPIRLGYDFVLNDNLKFFAEGGPYIAYALSGKTKYSGENARKADALPSTDFFGKKAFKRFDFGVGFALGLEVAKHYQLKVGYDLGLINTMGTSDQYVAGGGVTYKNRNFNVGIAYAF